MQTFGHAAFLHVDLQAFALADIADDRVTGNRAAARREHHCHAFVATHGDGRGLVASEGMHGRHQGFIAVVTAFLQKNFETARNHGGHPAAEHEIRKNVFTRLVARPLHDALPYLGGHGLHVDADLTQRLFEQTLAQLNRLIQLGRLEEMPDRRARLACAHEREPCGVRL